MPLSKQKAPLRAFSRSQPGDVVQALLALAAAAVTLVLSAEGDDGAVDAILKLLLLTDPLTTAAARR
jgi:hypothetical protein